MSEYPCESELETIQKWDLTKKPVKELLDYVERVWHWPDWGFKRTSHRLELHTGGWSGNEELISALRDNFIFWAMYWVEHRRGGHYVFMDDAVSKELKGFC